MMHAAPNEQSADGQWTISGPERPYLHSQQLCIRWHHDRFHHKFHHNRFFAFGFGGPIYDYAYDSCWTQVRTYYGWQWVNVCGD